jgi:hypothetical protein
MGKLVKIVKCQKRGDLVDIFNKLGFTRGAEVGVEKGKFSEFLCSKMPNTEIFCIDVWKRYDGDHGYRHQKNYIIARDRLEKLPNARLIKDLSVNVAKNFEPNSFDFVMEDIINWGRVVKKGGYICGHDYHHYKTIQVIEAVNAYVASHKIETLYVTDEKKPSWYFIK